MNKSIEQTIRGAFSYQTKTLNKNKEDAISHLRYCFSSDEAQEVIDQIEKEN